MRKKLTTYLEEDYIKKLKLISLEQEDSVADLLNVLVSNYFERKIVEIFELGNYIPRGTILYKEQFYTFNSYKNSEIDFQLLKSNDEKDEVVGIIECAYVEVVDKGKYKEVIELNTNEVLMIKDDFVKIIK